MSARENRITKHILAGFATHYTRFRQLAAAAKDCFERNAWSELRQVSDERLRSFDRRVGEAVERILSEDPAATEEAIWPEVKRDLILQLVEHHQPELVETFYNSVVCRVLSRSYFTNRYLFWRPVASTEYIAGEKLTYLAYYPSELGFRATFAKIFTDLELVCPWEDFERDLDALTQAFDQHFPHPAQIRPSVQLHIHASLFFRGRAAYLFGRLRDGPDESVFAIPILKNENSEAYLDAFLTGYEDLSQLITLSRAYFFTDIEVPSATVAFLRSAFPTRSSAELYTALGLQKQGKTLFYRELDFHLKHSTDQFVVAPGRRGMVMCVFTLPSFPWVFKLIRDNFEPPKDLDPSEVRRKYAMVKFRDRVGRMPDMWEYSDVALPASRISPALVEELQSKVPSLVSYSEDLIILKHLYIERRMVPLDLFLERAEPAQAREVLHDLGCALRELAGADFFCGDMLLKNFGVTRTGRVVFYDYDDLARVSECTFRRYPALGGMGIGPQDIFPEELPSFIFPEEEQRRIFAELHPELLDPGWWIALQERLRKGGLADIRPYPVQRCFRSPT